MLRSRVTREQRAHELLLLGQLLSPAMGSTGSEMIIMTYSTSYKVLIASLKSLPSRSVATAQILTPAMAMSTRLGVRAIGYRVLDLVWRQLDRDMIPCSVTI